MLLGPVQLTSVLLPIHISWYLHFCCMLVGPLVRYTCKTLCSFAGSVIVCTCKCWPGAFLMASQKAVYAGFQVCTFIDMKFSNLLQYNNVDEFGITVGHVKPSPPRMTVPSSAGKGASERCPAQYIQLVRDPDIQVCGVGGGGGGGGGWEGSR